MGKTIIQFDEATPLADDFLLFWDLSANAGEGGTRRGNFDKLAGIVAGNGLTASGGKVHLGGTIPPAQTADIWVDSGAFLDIHTETYATEFYIEEGGLLLTAQFESGGGRSELELSNSRAKLEFVGDGFTAIELFDQYIAVSASSSGGGVFFDNTVAYYTQDHEAILDSTDGALVNAGYLRTQLAGIGGGNPVQRGSNSFDFDQFLGFSFTGWDGPFGSNGGGLFMEIVNDTSTSTFEFTSSFAEALFAVSVGGAVIQFTEEGNVYMRSGDGTGFNYDNMSVAGTTKSATGTATAPNSYLGDSTYWLGRPQFFLKGKFGATPIFIPCYT